MRVIRSAGQNVSPSDDGRLFDQAFTDGLFEDATIVANGGNTISLSALYGIICGRDFTAEAQTISAVLPQTDTATGYVYVEFDTSSDDIITIGTALAPFTPTYENINTNGAVVQMVIAEYTASAVAVTSVTPTYVKASTGGVGSLAMIEASPATANHAVGTYLVYNGILYSVTSAIAIGETLVVGTNIAEAKVGDALSELKSGLIDVFSYDERKVGTWIDGKPLYRKTVYRSSLPNSTTTNYQHGIANVDTIFLDSAHSFIRWSSGSTASLPYLSTAYSSAVDVNNVSSTTYTVNTHGTDRSALSGYFTFLYTKTTD